MDLIYKICSRAEWQAALSCGLYCGSADDLRDGFIHFSRASQLRATAQKYFAGRTDLMLVAVARGALGPALRDEPSRGGDMFPHLYAPLAVDSVGWAMPLAWDGTQHGFPDGI
jgi:uncharacterized protein (DUF952 family)